MTDDDTGGRTGRVPAGAPSAVLCVGDVMLDVLALLPAPLETGTDTPAPVTLSGGGSAANTAAWLARAGRDVALVARVGDDPFGRHAHEELGAAGVRPVLAVDPDRPTGVCIVLVDAAGERTMVPSAGANEALAAADVADAELDVAAWLHVSGYPLLRESTAAVVADVLVRARRRGTPVSVDASSSAPLRSAGPATFLAAVGAPALLFANLDEAVLLTGETDPAAAARVLARRCGSAIVKCGGRGAVWSSGAETIEVAARTRLALDTTGAGDAFAAGVLASLTDDGLGDPSGAGAAVRAERALRAGCALAAQTLGHAGGRPR